MANQKQTKNQIKNQTKAGNTDVMGLPITATPRGLAILAQKLTFVLGKPVSVEPNGKSWLRLSGMDKEDHETLYNMVPVVAAELDAVSRWLNLKDGTEGYFYGPRMSEDILEKRGLTVDVETRIVSVNLDMYLADHEAKQAEREAKQAERDAKKAAKPASKAAASQAVLLQTLELMQQMQAQNAALMARLDAIEAKPATKAGKAKA